jgi:hypothetical protein
MKTYPLLLLLCSTNLMGMDSSDDIEAATSSNEIEVKIEDYYHSDTKILDLSNLPLKDEMLSEMVDDIEKLVTLTGAEQLILENNQLTKIPFDLITFALVNKTLKYVSFKNNKFKIQNGGDQPEEISKLLAKYKAKSSDKKETSKTRDRSGTISGVISTIWDGISPEIEKAIENYNKSSDSSKLFKKIIIIDKRIPPITIINQDALPKTTTQKCKDVFIKILYIGSGIVVTLIPTLSTYFSLDQTCDMNSLNSMMQACNISATTSF